MKNEKKKHRNGVVAAERHPSGKPAAETARQFGQSRVTNGVLRGSVIWLDNEDKRGPIPRRFKDIVGLVTADLGGADLLSECQRQLIRRIASLSVWCESQEARMASGDNIDIDEFQRASNSLRRICESIGLSRVARCITGPSLGDVLREGIRRDREAADAEVEV